MSNELPEGWVETTVGEIAKDITYGFTAKATSSPVGPRLLRITDIQNGLVHWDSVPYCKIPENRAANYILSGGDILFARTGATTGKSFLIKSCPEALFASYLIRVRPSLSVLPELLAQSFQSASYWSQISENLSGSAQPNCNASKLATVSLPLPPLAEQRRIVAKLEKLLGQVDACRQRLEKMPTLLKRFRQSILAAACSGRLTANWRNENPNLPEWKTVELVELGENIQIGPFGTQLHKADYISNGVPLINPTHIQASKIVHDPDFSVSQSKLKELGNYVLQTNDIIMGRRGEMARCALISKNENGWLCGTGSLFIRPKSTVSPDFLFLVLRSPETKAFLENEAQGSTMSNLNLEILRRVPVFISSLAEQQEIVRRVEILFALADQLELRLAQARKQVDQLTPSLLARAFAGKLVPQDPKDEPAATLLERIQSSRKVKA